MNSDGISLGILRVARSRTVQKATDASASSETSLKPAVPGRTMMSTPMKPIAIASQRRHPTGSPNISAAPSVMISGSAWRIAVALASGIWAIADRKNSVPPISPITRMPTGLMKSVRNGRSAPRQVAKAAISTIANRPRTTMISPILSSADTDLVMASFSVKAAMAAAISRLPRMLG